MNDKPEIEIKIFGGTNMIAPAGATAVQNFYGDQFAEVAIRPEETEGIESLNDAECLLFTYVPDVKKVHEYTRLLGECATAHDLAGVVSIMLSEPRVGKDTVVKGTFIEVLLPFASRLTSGAKVDNVRQQINNMLMRQGRGGKQRRQFRECNLLVFKTFIRNNAYTKNKCRGFGHH